MRRGLLFALLASVVASTWVLLAPAPPTSALVGVVAAREPGEAATRAALAQPLPARWNAPKLEAAQRNPFGSEAPPPPVAKPPPTPSTPPPKLAVAQPPAVLAAPSPGVSAAAPFAYRYLGRLVDPAGQRVVYVARGDVVVVVQVGTQMNDGYVVDSISEASIEFVNGATQQRHTIAIPPDASVTAAAVKTTP